MHRPVRALAVALLLALLIGSEPRASSSGVVISQLYGGGGNSGALFTHDFVELYNAGDAPASLDGWSLQYTSATGTGLFGGTAALITPLSGTIQPGRYVLVQEASQAAVGAALPVPDIIDPTPILMSATAGKVALVRSMDSLGCNGASTLCSPDALDLIVDLVGYGTANFFEGSGAAPGLSNTTAARRQGDGEMDTDNNAADFAAGAPTPRNSAFAPEPPPAAGCSVAATHEIGAVQGSGAVSPFLNQLVRVEGIVTGDFQASNQLRGFFFQDATPDGDPATSEGLFAFADTSVADVHIGDRVIVNGRAIEFNGLTELSPVTAIDICGSGAITPMSYDLPRPAGITFEPVEGMLLTFPEFLTVTEHFQLGRFGEITVAADGRLFQPTERVEPGPTAASIQDLNNRRRLLIDDGSAEQNPANVPFVSPIPGGSVRLGDTTSGVTGILSFGFGTYRLEPTAPISFVHANPRPTEPNPVGGNVRIASFNTLNYFTTLKSQNPDARGADTPEEFARQQVKEVQAITGLGADVVGLMEVENNGSIAVQSLVNALNAAAGANTYAAITEPILNPPNEFGGTFGTDAIKVALIYRPAMVTPLGAALSSADPIFDRPPLIQTFQRTGGGEAFTVAVNHFKSKNCDGTPGPNADQGDGQGCFNARRVSQATTLADLLNPLANVLVIGDLNSYSREDPIDALEAAGLSSVADLLIVEDDRYSFVFDGHSGKLDHALVSADLLDNLTGAAVWHINADEPLILDYNTEFNPSELYSPDAYRSSDHDPLLIGLRLNGSPVLDAGGPYAVVEGSTVTVSASGVDPDEDPLHYDWDLNADGIFESVGQTVSFSAAQLQAPQSITIAVRVTDVGGLSNTDSATVTVVWAFAGFRWPVRNPPAVNVAKAGWWIPVRFTLRGNQGSNIFAPGSPEWQIIPCLAGVPSVPIEPTATVGVGEGLYYVAALDEYWYIWKTSRSFAGTCRRLTVKLRDGTMHEAQFRFTK